MKKQRHIRTRLTFTLIGLTCAILLAVMLAFNIAVQSYIRSRVSTQLGEVTQNPTRQLTPSSRKPLIFPGFFEIGTSDFGLLTSKMTSDFPHFSKNTSNLPV